MFCLRLFNLRVPTLCLLMWDLLVRPTLRDSSKIYAPPPFADLDGDLEDLFKKKSYPAVIKKSGELLGEAEAPTTDDEISRVLRIWELRLRSLLCLRLGVQAAEEAAYLRNIEELKLPIAWDLRLLLTPAHAKGINQAAIQRYYMLAADASRMGWKDKMRSAGVSVAAALIGMRDYTTALAHLKALYEGEEPDYAQNTLGPLISRIYLIVGDTLRAREFLPPSNQQGLEALCEFSESGKGLGSISALYMSEDDALEQMESVAKQGNLADVQNLFLVYDLIYEDPRPQKRIIAEDLVANGHEFLPSYSLFSFLRA